MEPTTDKQPHCREIKPWDEKAEAQRELLHDPQRFADEMWEHVFTSAVEELNWSVYENQSRANLDDLVELIVRAFHTPGANTKDLVGHLGDLINNHAGAQEEIGRKQGVVLEQVRQALVSYFAAVAHEERNSDQWDGETVQRLRRELDLLDARAA